MIDIPRKYIYLTIALSVYIMMIVAVLRLLHEFDTNQFFQTQKASSAAFDGQEEGSSSLEVLAEAKGLSGILLPIGPDDDQLPGATEIWDVFLRADWVDSGKMDADGFDGLQAVKDVADFSKGSVAEILFSGTPQQAFRRGKFLLILNSYGSVQIVDCENSRAPKMTTSLPFRHVQHMEMQGEVAFLLLSQLDAQNNRLVVVDLSNPRKPRELTRLSLPEGTRSFFFWDRQLVVYANSIGDKGDRHLHLYDLTDDYQLASLGSKNTPLLNKGFLKFKQYLLVPDLRAGLQVWDFGNPLQPVIVASLPFPGRVKRLVRHADIVFALGFKNLIHVIDLQDPLHPVLSTVVEEANHSAFLVEVGNHLYYLTENGHLQVFDFPSFTAPSSGKRSTGIVGELLPTQTGGGFSLLSNVQAALPATVTKTLTLPDELNVIDQLFWHGELVVLGADGLIQLFHEDKKLSLQLKDSLRLSSPQRWLVVSGDRLYIGGEATVSVVAKKADGSLVLSGQIDFPGEESWDGLVIQQTLCVAAGKDGVLCFSIESQDRLIPSPGWVIPQHLASLVDVRQLATPGKNRMLVAAGSAGLFSGQLAASGQFQLDGFINFIAPIYALAVVEDFCLVSTGSGVDVVDIRTRQSLQNLGKIAFTGVGKFAVAEPGLWAGYAPQTGWSVLPVPRFVSPEEAEILSADRSIMLSEPLQSRYRLNLFNSQEVISIPGALTLSSVSGSRMSGAAHGLQ